MDQVTVYDRTGKMLAVLDNATGIGYELKHNDLWTATFSLPADDPKNRHCTANALVALPLDGTRDCGIYRIAAMPHGEEGMAGIKTYALEHVMTTLLDDLLFGYHEVGGEGQTTADVIRYILARQTTVQWQLGDCDFTDQYQYHFENVSLLSALLSLGEVLAGEYTWVWDTAQRPWTVHLKKADDQPGCGIHYGRNLVGITKTMDASMLVTRLYPLGYGEGVNQLTIRPVNGGVPFIDADTIGTWGIRSNVFADTRIQDAASLMARAQAVLEGCKHPYVTYSANAIDLQRLTGHPWDTYMPGKLVRVMDGEHGIDLSARIVSVAKQDVQGRPGELTITIANGVRDAAESINTLADRVGIGELYSQGATNLLAQSFADNADADHPALFRVYVPAGMVRINRMLLQWRIAPFRAYEVAAAAGGGSTRTSSAAGNGSISSEAGGMQTLTKNLSVRVIASIGGPTEVTSSASKLYTDGTELTTQSGGGQGVHTHSISSHRHKYDHSHSIVASTEVPPLVLELPAHTHTVQIPAHSHTVEVPEHTHAMVYGIYEGGRASSISLRVDGHVVPAEGLAGGEVDVVTFLAKDQDGRIMRNSWHTIELIPDSLTRIEANLFAQCFIQSVGGGDY